MLMTEFTYYIHETMGGSHTVVMSLIDDRQKYFFNAQHGAGFQEFMDSLTDELVDGFWPKKASGIDNWSYLDSKKLIYDRKLATNYAQKKHDNIMVWYLYLLLKCYGV